MANEGIRCFSIRQRRDGASGTKTRSRNQAMQLRKENSRKRLFQTCEALSLFATAVNAYGRLKTKHLSWPTLSSGLPAIRAGSMPGAIIATEDFWPRINSRLPVIQKQLPFQSIRHLF